MKHLRGVWVLTSLALISSSAAALATPAIPVANISRVFAQVSSSPYLAGPSMILIDRSSGEIVFQTDATSLRKPASVLKLLSTSAAMQYLDPNYKYVTRIAKGLSPRTLVISGNLDPWMTGSYFEANKYHRAWLQYLVNRSIADLKAEEASPLRSVSIEYSGFYSNDVGFLKRAYAAIGVTPKIKEISANHVASVSGQEIASVTSPSISAMVKFALTWSDNLLAERLARAASHAIGYPMNDAGVALTIKRLLGDLGVDQSGLYIHDASGLSHQDRVTAKLIADLLLKIRGNEKFAAVYEGLPISGISGTLESRFVNTAPQAVGLIHAKTGTLDGTVSLAGYVESGTHEYVFVAIADHIRKGQAAADQARNTLDRLLGKITAPLERAKVEMAKVATP
jgi:D-alanyl-D-alanine carboxypeptidase/D-alanyl-D-alanine-endopeptidase (penicillin-binding protein 4)